MGYVMDRVEVYEGVKYRVLDELISNYLLVVREEDFKKEVFPMQTYIIPGD